MLNRHQEDLYKLVPNSWKSRTLHAVRKCRTIALGGHIDACDCCNTLHLSYNSCRNRHCPTCQGHKREQWIAKRSEELLNIPYYHVVFTIPHELNALCLHNPKLVYATLFKTAWETIKGFAENPKNLGARNRHDCPATHLGTKLATASSFALHCSGRRRAKKWRLENE